MIRTSAGHRETYMRSGKILVLESNESLRLPWARALSREGYYVTSASSIEEAVAAAKQQSFELLIIRTEEPELLNMFLAQFPPEIGALVIATRDTASRILEFAGLGAHSILIEPFSLSKFKEAVAQNIDRTRAIEESLQTKILTNLEKVNHLPACKADMSQLCKIIVEISAAATRADYVSLAVRDEATGNFVINAENGDAKPSWKTICQEVMEIGEPVLIDETTQNHLPLSRLMNDTGISGMLCVPLVIKGYVVGAMSHIKVTDGAKFASSDLNYATVLASWSSTAIENARLYLRLQKQRLRVDELLHEISVAQENERRRLAIQIHDGVAQWLVGASYNIKACRTLITESKLTELERELYNVEKTLQRSVKELRRAIANLRPLPLEEVGLIDAIRRQTDELGEEKIRCHTEIEGELPELSFTEETTTYWIVQEILTNIRNHSRASEVNLRISFNDTTVSVEVTDNGRGFNPDEVLGSAVSLEHMGLMGMQERARLIGGNLAIHSSPGQGTSIGFTFPVSSRVAIKTMV